MTKMKSNAPNPISSKRFKSINSSPFSEQNRYQEHHFHLQNGLGLSVIAFPGIKTVSLRCFVFVGSVYENEKNSGISHFLEHMLFRGNEKLGDAATMSIKMEELGGEFNAATSFDQTEYWLDLHQDYLQQGIERFCQFLRYPLFEQLEIERSIILEEIIGDYNEENRLIDLDSLTSGLLWPEHAMGMPIIGNTETVKKISRSDLMAWHKRFYTPANMIIGITGDVSASEILEIVGKQFDDTKIRATGRYKTIEVKPRVDQQLLLVSDKDNQFGIQWSFPSYRLNKNLRIEFELLRRILDGGNSSRLQRLIREEKGLVYDISLDTTYYNRGMIMSLQSVVGINKLEELVSSLVDMINELITNGVTQEELDLAKLRYRTALECTNDTAQGILYNTLMPKLHPAGVTSEKVLSTLKTISLETINSVLRQLFVQRLSTFVLVGPWTEKDQQMLKDRLQPWIRGKNSS